MSKPPWVGVGLDKPKPPAADGGERVLESLNATLHKFRAAIHVGDRVKDRHSGRLGTCLFVGPADFAKGKEVCGLRLDKARTIISPTSPLYLRYISAISPLYLSYPSVRRAPPPTATASTAVSATSGARPATGCTYHSRSSA